MKKSIALLLALLLVISLAGCQKAADKPADPAAAETKAEVGGKAITIGLVTDTGGIDDKSFNQGTYEGLQRYVKDAGLPTENLSFLQSVSDADYIPNLSQFADEKKDLIVAPGFLFEKAITEISKDYPEQKILFLDAVVDAPNVFNAVFAEHEGSFLVGVAAALKAQDAGKNKVGFVGGADFDLIQKFEAGFEQGVKAVDPKMEIVINYASGFDKAEEGQTIATKMFNEGCYVIYHAAGGTGNGVIKEGKDRVAAGEDVWVIGVDKDQFEEGKYGDGSKSVILTSMVKAVDHASYVVADMVAKDQFKGGIYVFDLKENGVRLPENNPNLKEEWVKKVDDFADKIKAGEIKVDPVPERVKGKN